MCCTFTFELLMWMCSLPRFDFKKNILVHLHLIIFFSGMGLVSPSIFGRLACALDSVLIRPELSIEQSPHNKFLDPPCSEFCMNDWLNIIELVVGSAWPGGGGGSRTIRRLISLECF